MNFALIYFLLIMLALTLLMFEAWRALPMLILILSPRQIRCWFLDAVESERIIAYSDEIRKALERLQALGFELLGVKVELPPFRKQVVEEVALEARDAYTFASIFLMDDGNPGGVYFYTPFRGGGMVFTRGRSNLPEVENDNTSIRNIPSSRLEDLYQSHQKRVQTLQGAGLLPIEMCGKQSRLEATYLYYSSDYSRQILQRMLFLPPMLNFWLAMCLLGVTLLAWMVTRLIR